MEFFVEADGTCEFCQKEDGGTKTHDGKNICWDCVDDLNMCEICGSIAPDGNLDDQKHYEDECFK